jgi:hypothetical protein
MAIIKIIKNTYKGKQMKKTNLKILVPVFSILLPFLAACNNIIYDKLFQSCSINIPLISSQSFIGARNLALSGNFIYVAGGTSFSVYDISNPAAPSLSGSQTIGIQVDEIALSGGYVYIGIYTNNSLRIFNASSPYAYVSNCIAIGSNWIYGLYVSGNYAYAALGNRYFGIYNISIPASPSFIGNCSIGGATGNAFDVYVSGNYAYVAHDNVGLKIIDITTPLAPAVIGTCTTNTNANGVTVSGNYAYLAAGASGLLIIDISNPASPVLVSTCNTPGNSRSRNIR